MNSELHAFSELVNEVISELQFVAGWIKLQDPKIESGNNFGVEVLEDHFDLVIDAVGILRSSMTTLEKSQRRRGNELADMYKSLSKIADLPAQSLVKRSFMHSIVQMDIGMLRDIITAYSYMSRLLMQMHGKLIKNMNTLLKPRSNDNGHAGVY